MPNALRFLMKKYKYIKDQKLFIKGANLFFFLFHQKSEGIWHLPSAGTFNQNLRAITVYSSDKVFFSFAMPLGCPQITAVCVNAPSCKRMIKIANFYV